MKRRILVTMSLCILVALATGSFASVRGDPAPAAPEPVPAGHEPAIVRVYYPNLDMANKVLLAFEPWLLETNYEAGYHVMQVTQEELDRLLALGLRVERDDKWVAPPVAPALAAGLESIPSYPCYRTVEETFAAAQALVAAHPDLATWIDVGNSWQKTVNQGGYDMMVLKLTNSAIAGPKPKLFITAAIHAREYATAELVTRFGEYLVNNYGIDADATWILDHHEVHLMLHTNPDGRKMAETGLSWRKNTNSNYCWLSSYRGADLNRNFAFQWACCGGSSSSQCNETYHGPSPASEPETQAVQAYLDAIFPDQRGPNLSDPAPSDATGVYLDVHSYGQLVLWPWGFTSGTAPNATVLQTLGRKFAYFNSHTPQQSYALYATDGTTDDHAYGNLGVAAYCFEVGTAFFQSCSYFESTLLPANMPALIYAAKVVRTPYLTPAGPDALSLALSSGEVPAGTPVTLSATINDTRYNNTNGTEPTQNIAAAEYYVDLPPWVTGATAYSMAASDGSFDAKAEAVTAMVDTTGWSTGQHILFVRGQDAAGNWGAFSSIFLTTTGPANQPPTADPQSLTTAEDTALAITLTGSDPEGDPLTFAVQSGPGHGALSGTAPDLTYTPAADYSGPDSFAFVANDGHANSVPATVSLTVTPVNDAPVADPQSVTTEQDIPLPITLTGSDIDGDALSYAVAEGPSHGTLSGDAPNLTYTPDSNYIGNDGFAFTVDDGMATSAPAAVSITVTPVNHPPVAYGDTVTTGEDTPVAITLTGFDQDGYNGPDSFIFVVNDGQVNSEPGTVNITVAPVNDAPLANPQSVTTQQDTPVAITLTGSDVEGSALTFQVVDAPAQGSLSGTPPNLTYTPVAGYAGEDSFTFKANDGELDSNVATVNITVNASGPTLYLGSSTSGAAGGVAFADEDILIKDVATGAWALFIDGSDIGLANTDIDAFELDADGSLLVSFDTAFTLSGFGAVDDSDILRFVPTATGATTAGTWQWYFDGSDVGLSTNDEDVDAFGFAPDGRLLISTLGNVSVTGASGADEDLLAFTPAQLGATTSGTWALYFDGSDVGLSNTSNEDVNGVWVDATGNIYLTTLGNFSVTGVSGDGSDIFVCTPGSLGTTTACTWAMYWDGSASGFSGEVTDSFGIVP
jgi:carboxypeptidase T